MGKPRIQARMELLGLLAVTLLTACAVMALVWAYARRINNASIVDGAWAGLFSVLAAELAWLGPGDLQRRLVLAGMVVLWSVRLTFHLVVRIASHHPVEDDRYLQLRKEWAPHVWARFFRFFQAQAVSTVLLSAPMIVVALNPAPGLSWAEMSGVVLFAIALLGEAASDAQLRAFKARADSAGKPCREGLWKYSRHPNYFFEWLVWCAFFLFALGSPWGVLTILCPVTMFILVTRVTGIPLTEQQALRSRGDAYREYQRTTSVFVPWFPRA
jgi:steroid 5-alpha reductase family enzyme